ncbi:MAG: hypothetical protein ACP6IU_02725 [Candidatus Asgardarchaeia archaeon]
MKDDTDIFKELEKQMNMILKLFGIQIEFPTQYDNKAETTHEKANKDVPVEIIKNKETIEIIVDLRSLSLPENTTFDIKANKTTIALFANKKALTTIELDMPINPKSIKYRVNNQIITITATVTKNYRDNKESKNTDNSKRVKIPIS